MQGDEGVQEDLGCMIWGGLGHMGSSRGLQADWVGRCREMRGWQVTVGGVQADLGGYRKLWGDAGSLGEYREI